MSEFALIAGECVNADIRAKPSISGEGKLAPGPQPPLAVAPARLSAKCLQVDRQMAPIRLTDGSGSASEPPCRHAAHLLPLNCVAH